MNPNTEINNLRLKIGSASKGGAIEIHGDVENPEEFKTRIDRAYSLREYALMYQNGEIQPKAILQEPPLKKPMSEDLK